ncbi:hypothetical protein IKD82_00100 [Candidatus Saccharibacteria bacterium]|nr:hypothetical protein [Candidatus Saccharibacteria bacterium]
MNKDVIYIEPDDDITDIIMKIENSKEKIVALVPPKKAGVFRSVVNIKLIAKAGVTSNKKIVLVTTDPSINKLAAATKLPVTKNLQSAPAIPTLDEEEDETASTEELIEESDNEANDEEDADKPEEEDKKAEDPDEEDDEEEEEDEEEPKKANEKKKNKKGKSAKSANKIIDWIKTNKKLSIGLGVGGLFLILFLIWALVIAPSVTVTVGIRTNSNNFSQNVSFTSKLDSEDVETGKFYLEEKKIETSQEVKFEATGKKNVGEKAHGEVTVIARINYIEGGTKVVNAGDKFTISGLTFTADSGVTMRYNGVDYSVCSNINEETPIGKAKAEGCQIYAKVKVTATEPGTKYNISPAENGWTTTADVSVFSAQAMSGGTDQEITIVTQADIDKAKSELAATDQDKNKEELMEKVGDDNMVIDSSFIQKTSDAVSTPAVGEEVKEGVTPTLKATTVASVFVLDKTKVEEFITKKANLSESQKIYEMKNPFIESFLETDSGYTGKLKTSYATGPKITENDVIEKIKGKGLGEAQHDLRDIDGVSGVTIDKSFPWVTGVPGDPNKITVIFDVKDQNGNTIEAKEKSEESADSEEKQDSEKTDDKTDDKKN